MKKFIILISTMAFLLTGSTAFATKFYNKGSFGLAVADDTNLKENGINSGNATTKRGFFVSGALGIQPINWLRGEFEVSYQKYDLDTFENTHNVQKSLTKSMSSANFMINGYIDLYTGSRLTPYLMLGIGKSVNRMGNTLDEENWFGNSFQSGFGFGYTITKTIMLDFEYKYLKTSEYTKDNLKMTPGGINNFIIGFRHFF